MMISVNNQSPKKQMAHRKTINVPCSSLNLCMTDMIKDEELMPPPSRVLTQDYGTQCENSNSNINSKYSYIYFFVIDILLFFIIPASYQYHHFLSTLFNETRHNQLILYY